MEKKPSLAGGRVGRKAAAPATRLQEEANAPMPVERPHLAQRTMFAYKDQAKEEVREEWGPRPRRISERLPDSEATRPFHGVNSEDWEGEARPMSWRPKNQEPSPVASMRFSRGTASGENGPLSRSMGNGRRFSTTAMPHRPNPGNRLPSPYRPNAQVGHHQNSQRPNNGNGNRNLRIGGFSLGGLRNLEIFRRKDFLDHLFANTFRETDEVFDLMQAYAQTQVELLKFVGESALMPEEHMPSRSKILDVCMLHALEEGTPIRVEGVLEQLDNGDGAIVYAKDSFRLQAKSTFVPHCLLQSYGLRRGQNISAYIHPPKEQSSCPFALRIIEVMGLSTAQSLPLLPKFKELTPCYPTERLLLESPETVPWDNLSMRVVDLLTPIGLGQRGLIVAAPRTGKTMLLQHIANAIVKARPDAHVLILLIDERPEEVTDFARHVPAEVISSTFDESAENHVAVADMAIENARRRVEAGQHVVILLDSLTRLARAHNTRQPSSGKILSGGMEANALQEPKSFFGAARNIEGGGSLTILATALVETGSRMDDVIFEEFKGTGNMELHLDRMLVEKRIFPAINLEKSGTRREELLYHPDEMEKIYTLRRALKGVPSMEAMEMLLSRLKKTRSNVEFLLSVNR
ncbi:MAG: transcription termination factor Rho [Puniceicoccales bacterium]|nr:transcription termination factor Rho [Puniceicoccales bacterium]